MAIEFRVLGPAEIVISGKSVVLPSNKPSIVLATLLLHPNEIVAVDRLYDTIWGERPPASARATLQTYVMRLRQLLVKFDDKCAISTSPGGYSITATAANLDLLKFRELRDRARDFRGEPEEESLYLGQALSLWRGTPLANIPSDTLVRDGIPQLAEERLEAAERRFELELALGRHRTIIGELRAYTAAHREREQFWEQLIDALYRSARQAEALEEYAKVKQYLHDELGVDPCRRLQELEVKILRGEQQPEAPPAEPVRTVAAPPAVTPIADPGPRLYQLPPEVADFVGREQLVHDLLADVRHDLSTGRPSLTLIHGAAGIGKSALTVRVAHRLRNLFSDGQWYVQLSGADSRPRSPLDILEELLVTAGVDPHAVPCGLAARAAAFRSAIADRKILFLFDDAADAQQVWPLLPGTPGSTVLLTSRMRMTELTALLSSRSHLLPPLDPAQSLELLRLFLGRGAVRMEHSSAVELAELCGHLPLALRIAAAQISGLPGQRISHHLNWLRADVPRRMSIGHHPRLSLFHLFDVSLARLSEAARALFLRLGHLPAGSEFTVRDLAAGLDATGDEIELLLGELRDASMVLYLAPGRYALHSLVHIYAAFRCVEGAVAV
ncbi:BTAD domain-containing putative transcriptional regulator [Microbispora sp. CA-135349]|uniref:AfsR/SARP family transcriptional regulator n=1 Tax=Microbispora sp. CA-135349 TaxID=3239953 RepID=UPI003D8B93A6